MVTNGQNRFFGPFIAILTPVVVMYTCYDFSFTFFFKVLVVALILVVRTSNSVENWRHYEFLICATYLHFWPQHGLIISLARQGASPKWWHLSHHYSSKMKERWIIGLPNKWWGAIDDPGVFPQPPSSLLRRQPPLKQAGVWWGRGGGDKADDFLTHAVMPPPLYTQYWEYLHTSFCM